MGYLEDYLLEYGETNYPERRAELSIAFLLPSVESVAELKKSQVALMMYQKAQEVSKEIDGLLDEYNDNMRLYETFGDAEYKTKADVVLAKLRREVGE